MRGVQPHGPYRLGGFCNGGLLAYEMACQLERDGEQVSFLGLINPSEPAQSSLLRSVCARLGSAWPRDTRSGEMRPGGARPGGARPGRAWRTAASRPADLYLRARHAQRHIYRRLRPGGSRVQDFGQLLAIEPRLAAMFPPREALYQDYVGVFSWAAAGYTAGVYRGRITFYWARDEPGIAHTWQSVTSRKAPADVQEHVVAGTHMSCVTDHIKEMALALAESLDKAEQEAASVEVRAS
jgi:thioesterase domain-containing protein